MRTWFKVAVIAGAAVLGAGMGAGSFLYLASQAVGEVVTIGPWQATTAIGEVNQNPYSRARVAMYGIWGLPESEAIYYIATVDGSLQPITEKCRYRLTGTDAPARWWSLTVYRDGFYIDNPHDRFSWNSSIAPRGPDGTWEIILSAKGQEPNGLALGDRPGTFQLSYRLYQPDKGVAQNRAGVKLPRIERIDCSR